MSMNPRETTDKIKSDYKDYIASILSVKDKEITDLSRIAVQKTEFVKGPYLETTLPFVDGKSLKELAEEGLVSKEFAVMGSAVHYEDWKLRIHQENALRKIITEDKNMVVSTGTGSGKTECYLYPIFNALMREKEQGILDAGVRALLIFPMNALANDQQKKLRKLLVDYPDITFGRYTGETESKKRYETAEQAERRMHEEYNIAHANDTDGSQRKALPNEMMCRETMTKTPPHILLTNYAMLEYLLLRPDTAPFFDNSSAKHWRYIVIDEAHTYKGANGTEIAFLLRRLKERIRKNMHESFKCIATSATLGSEDSKAGLALFAQNLFGETFDESDVITTKRKNREQPLNGHAFSPIEYKEIKTAISKMEEEEKGKYLYDVLSKDLRLFTLYDVLKSKPKRIEDVASVVFADLETNREATLIDLIELSAAARRNEYESALLPARYHLFVKSLEGMFVQYYPRKRVFLDRKEFTKEGNKNFSVFELANCQKCGQEYLVGRTSQTACGNYFIQTSSHDKPEYYFISNESEDNLKEFDEDDSVEETDKLSNLERYHLCLCCGRITPFAEKQSNDCCDIEDSRKIVTVYNLRYSGKGSESNCCPCCGATRKGLIKRFLTANQPATFAVAKSLYEAIPPRPVGGIIPEEDIFDSDLFDDLFDNPFEDEDNDMEISTELLDESGRKLLIFSDNRQEAAFFAGFLEKKYTLMMWRKVILQCLRNSQKDAVRIDDLIEKVMIAAEKSSLYSYDKEKKIDMSDDQKRSMAAHYIMQEYLNPDVATGLEGLGYVQIMPAPMSFKDSFELAGLKQHDLWNLFRFMMDTLRQKGAVSYPEMIRATDEFFSPRNHVGYFRQMGSSTTYGEYVYGFIPADNTTNKRLGMMLKLEDQTLDKEQRVISARKKLNDVYNVILRLVKNGYIVQTTNNEKGIVYCLNYAKWYLKLTDDEDIIYRCKKCGKVFSYSIKNICPELKCDGELEPVMAKEVKNDPYYSKIYEDDKLIPMVSREHTAQLSNKTAGEYQKDFEDGKINILSCSTTFEMGVDVGELEATFQRNVPPETSNYIQRAGRAGRRTSSAAFSVTFSRRSSHDMTFFQDPTKIIAGKISAPVLEIDNEKIAERHLNSIVISWFFKRKEEFFRENTKRIINSDDCDNMAVALEKLLTEHPKDLLDSIHASLPENICSELGVDEWRFISYLTGKDGSLTKAIEERKADVDGLKHFSREAMLDENMAFKRRAFAADKVVSTLESEQSINFLSSKGVLPKYGFPVDSVSLDILSGDSEEAKKIDLSRDLKMAISEFAPPSEIIANGKVWKSYAINTVPSKSWPTYIYYECDMCKRIYPPKSNVVDITVDLSEIEMKPCRFCNTKMNPRKFIIPIFGFSTKMGDKPKAIGENKPSTYYSTQTQFWGIDGLTEKQAAEARDRTVVLKGKNIDITYSPGGKLFVLNQGQNRNGLRVCPQCGFTAAHNTILKGGKHETKFNRVCGNRNLIKVSLGHNFSTDILKINLPTHEIDLDFPDSTLPKDQYLSVLYAILEGASHTLNISRDDIDGCVAGDGSLIIFDDTAGGAGFAKNIYTNFEDVLRAALNKVNGKCGCTEETSCYGCLRNYSNQVFHDNLSRGLAKHYLHWLLNSEIESNNTDKIEIKKKEMVTVESVGLKQSNFEPSCSPSTFDDTVTALENARETAEDETIKQVYSKLIDFAKGKNFEHPMEDEPIEVEQSIWPELLWAKSHVALFLPGQEKQYKILKKYDWYCYVLDENINPELVFSHIKEEI